VQGDRAAEEAGYGDGLWGRPDRVADVDVDVDVEGKLRRREATAQAYSDAGVFVVVADRFRAGRAGVVDQPVVSDDGGDITDDGEDVLSIAG
jgi:hypothetical protein